MNALAIQNSTTAAHRFRPSPVPFDGLLAGRVRSRFAAACDEIGTGHRTILGAFDEWRYTKVELTDMKSWSDSAIVAWCLRVAEQTPGEWTPELVGED